MTKILIAEDDGELLQLFSHVLEKNGFVRCGIVMFEGDAKLAYDCLF